MKQSNFRKPSDVEVQILRKMTELSIPHITDLVSQISAAQVRTIDQFGSIEFEIDCSLRADVPDGPILNAIQPDRDTIKGYGPFINYILFVKDGLIRELQIYKDDGGVIRDVFDATKISEVFPGHGVK